MQELRGTGVALITPFTEGQIDYPALEKMITHVVEGGVDYIVTLGTTGESMTLTKDEKRRVIDYTIEKVNGRIPIVAGNFGGSNTAAICQYIEQFDFTGITAILSSSPAYLKPSQDGIYLHYKAISEYCPLPVILYNVPGRTASNITAETTLRIAHDCPTVKGIKEASGDMTQASQILQGRPDGFLVISGDDPTAFPLIGVGGDGVISVIANILPGFFSDLINAALKGDRDSARAMHERLLSVHPLLYREGNPAGVKGAASILGLCRPEVRLPLTSASATLLSALQEAMKEASFSIPAPAE